MPRRTAEEAKKAAQAEGFARLRFLVRNTDFRKDLVELRRLEPDDQWPSYSIFLRKWDLQWFPKELFEANDRLPGTAEDYEQAIIDAEREAEADPNPINRNIVRPPVTVSDPNAIHIDDLLAPEHRKASSHIPLFGRVIHLEVDLDYPQDVIEAEIHLALQAAKEHRRNLEEQGRMNKRPERLRLDKVDFYLQVFDRAEGGEPYRTIAVELNKPKSTIQSAHVAAIRLVGSGRGLNKPKEKGPAAREPFNFERHIAECATCKAAEGPAEYCDGCRSWIETHLVREYIPFDELREVQDEGERHVAGDL